MFWCFKRRFKRRNANRFGTDQVDLKRYAPQNERIEGGRTIFLGDVSKDAEEQDIKELFEPTCLPPLLRVLTVLCSRHIGGTCCLNLSVGVFRTRAPQQSSGALPRGEVRARRPHPAASEPPEEREVRARAVREARGGRRVREARGSAGTCAPSRFSWRCEDTS